MDSRQHLFEALRRMIYAQRNSGSEVAGELLTAAELHLAKAEKRREEEVKAAETVYSKWISACREAGVPELGDLLDEVSRAMAELDAQHDSLDQAPANPPASATP